MCNPPHLWARLEDSSGKHYEPGYIASCVTDRMTLIERMQRDAVLLKPGQEATGSFSFDSKIFRDQLKPEVYRLEAVLCGWNLPFDGNQLHDLAGMGAPFLIGESDAVSEVELLSGGK